METFTEDNYNGSSPSSTHETIYKIRKRSLITKAVITMNEVPLYRYLHQPLFPTKKLRKHGLMDGDEVAEISVDDLRMVGKIS